MPDLFFIGPVHHVKRRSSARSTPVLRADSDEILICADSLDMMRRIDIEAVYSGADKYIGGTAAKFGEKLDIDHTIDVRLDFNELGSAELDIQVKSAIEEILRKTQNRALLIVPTTVFQAAARVFMPSLRDDKLDFSKIIRTDFTAQAPFKVRGGTRSRTWPGMAFVNFFGP